MRLLLIRQLLLYMSTTYRIVPNLHLLKILAVLFVSAFPYISYSLLFQ